MGENERESNIPARNISAGKYRKENVKIRIK